MTFENETGDRGRTWCAWPDWPMTPDYDLAPNPIILRVTKQKWPCRQGGPRIIRGWTGQSRGECRQWQPFGCHQSRSVLITCWFTTKHFFFFLNSINQGYLFYTYVLSGVLCISKWKRWWTPDPIHYLTDSDEGIQDRYRLAHCGLGRNVSYPKMTPCEINITCR